MWRGRPESHEEEGRHEGVKPLAVAEGEEEHAHGDAQRPCQHRHARPEAVEEDAKHEPRAEEREEADLEDAQEAEVLGLAPVLAR